MVLSERVSMGVTWAARSDPFDQERNGPTGGVELSLWLKIPVVFYQLLPSMGLGSDPMPN
jgi:hypothetical protein